jgi:transposase-like protein
VHKLRNLLTKLPERLHREVEARYWAALDEARSPTQAKAALQALARDDRRAYPSCTRALEDDLDALVVHLRFPSEHRERIRSTNLLERSFVEIRRRTKLIGRFPGETSALCLIWAVLELASRGWRGVTMTPRAVAEIERIRRALAAGEPLPEPAVDEEVIAAEDDNEAELRPSTFTRTMGRHPRFPVA